MSAGGQGASQANWVPLVFGLSLCLLAAPRFAASVAAIPGDYVVWLIAEGKTPSRGKLEVLWESREYAAKFVDSERYWSQMALAGAILGNLDGWRGVSGQNLRERTRRAQETGLTRSPLNSLSWLRYAYLAGADSPRDGVAAGALSMSYKTGPFIDEIAESRLKLAAIWWDSLGGEAHRAAMAEARYLWLKNPSRFAKMAAGNGRLTAMVEKAARNLE